LNGLDWIGLNGMGWIEWNGLIAAKNVTASKLIELMLAGTIDPTPSFYNTTM
jgi:hypothetical protein